MIHEILVGKREGLQWKPRQFGLRQHLLRAKREESLEEIKYLRMHMRGGSQFERHSHADASRRPRGPESPTPTWRQRTGEAWVSKPLQGVKWSEGSRYVWGTDKRRGMRMRMRRHEYQRRCTSRDC